MKTFIIIFILLIIISGCTETTSNEQPKEFTLEEVISVFETLAWEMHNTGGIPEERVSEILGMGLVQDPEFIAVFHAYTGNENVNVAVSWKRDSQEEFLNASMIVKTDELDIPIPMSRIDIQPYVLAIEPGTKLQYFEHLFDRPGILTDYIFGNFKYRWFSSSFNVIVEVDENFEVKKLEVD